MRKTFIFAFLSVAFVAYSFFVFTTGTETQISSAINKPLVSDGKLLWQKHNCIACHQLYGLGGYLGPELTTVISQKGENYARAFISSGTLLMPNFHLNEHEINALTEFLKYVDETAVNYKNNEKN